MSETKIIRSYEDAIEMMMQGGRMIATGAYDKVKSSTSSMDYPSKNVMVYR